MGQETYTKVDDYTVRITTTETQEVEMTFDEMLLSRENMQGQIANLDSTHLENRALLTGKLDEIDARIAAVRALGIVPSA